MLNLNAGQAYSAKATVVNTSVVLGKPAAAQLTVFLSAAVGSRSIFSGQQSYKFAPGETHDFSFPFTIPSDVSGAGVIVGVLSDPSGKTLGDASLDVNIAALYAVGYRESITGGIFPTENEAKTYLKAYWPTRPQATVELVKTFIKSPVGEFWVHDVITGSYFIASVTVQTYASDYYPYPRIPVTRYQCGQETATPIPRMPGITDIFGGTIWRDVAMTPMPDVKVDTSIWQFTLV